MVETELDFNANFELSNVGIPVSLQACFNSEGAESSFEQAHEVKNVDYISSGENRTANSNSSSAGANL